MRANESEQGVILLTLIGMLMPLLLIAGAFTSAMSARSAEQQHVLDRERALLAAESGVDDAIFRGQIGLLVDDVDYSRSLAGGMTYRVEPDYLGNDGVDNDQDKSIDEPDEDVFQVVCTGVYRRTERKVAVYLGPVPPLALNLRGAMAVYNPTVNISLNGTTQISGDDTNLDGSLTGSSEYGMTIALPGTTADLLSSMTPAEQSKVVGTGGAPSVSAVASASLDSLVTQIQNTANIVLTSNHYSAVNLGDGSAGESNIIYREGSVRFDGNTQGSGVMLVTGDLVLAGTFRFDGVIIVLGDVVNAAGTAEIYGGIVQGPSGGNITAKGTFDVHFSSEAIALANKNVARYVSFNGWQELAQ